MDKKLFVKILGILLLILTLFIIYVFRKYHVDNRYISIPVIIYLGVNSLLIKYIKK
ncbi:hypothetical protein [Oceanivirga salmonicida]|uniref:hypothetical protein n=1 Tax=Oceanivirga salmonicida TaxID=1769291 RepID=UPI0012E20B46|nr:hypothetical protein [Oceanivirga salmonicida]